jgi:hypothetical protein
MVTDHESGQYQERLQLTANVMGRVAGEAGESISGAPNSPGLIVELQLIANIEAASRGLVSGTQSA